MTDTRIEATAFITPVPGKESELRERLKAVVALTQKESGCLEFQAFELEQSPGRFILWEIFESNEALELHLATTYTRDYFASGLVAATEVQRHRSILT